MEESKKGKVLVTGITGFLGSYLAKLLLERGYHVRGTLRDKKNEAKMRVVNELGSHDKLEIVEADLLKPETWLKAVEGCNMVAHVASPFPIGAPKNEKLLIKTATEGTTNVLRACSTCKEVKAVVITSSISAIQDLSKHGKDEFTEMDWPNLDSINAYAKSKTLAEKAAWNFYNSLDKSSRFKMSVINPGFILGPALVYTNFSSGDSVRQTLAGELPGIPWIGLSIVDVRDVAAAHIAALESPASDGQRYICTSDEHLWFEDMVNILREEFGKYGYNITRKKIKFCYAKAFSFVSSSVSDILPLWGKDHIFINKKIKKQFGMEFIKPKESIIKMAYSLIEHGLVKNLINKK